MVEDYLSVLDLGYYEVQFAFEGMADELVWKRPAEGLLSVGELAGHIAYSEAVRFAGEGGDNLEKCQVRSPLIDQRFAYYPKNMAQLPSEEHLAMTGEQVYRELMRVHEESVAVLKARNPDLDSNPPGESGSYTYRECLKYMAFHIAYHTGQIYSVRHLLGEQTPDN